MKFAAIVSCAFLFFSCGVTDDENLHAITSQQTLTRKAIAEKYDLVKPIEKNHIIGKWKLIASFMTIEMSDGSRGNTILPGPLSIYDIRENGDYYLDGNINEACKWKLIENNTTFFDWGCDIDPEDEIEDYDKLKIRIGKDTMEWIMKVDEEYIYQVLVKQ